MPFALCTSSGETVLFLEVYFWSVYFSPQMIKSLKKSLSPVLSDISIEWLFPETKEVLLSPVGNTFLFPGDSLIGYCVVCDTTRYHTNPKSVSARHLLKCDKWQRDSLCCEYLKKETSKYTMWSVTSEMSLK